MNHSDAPSGGGLNTPLRVAAAFLGPAMAGLVLFIVLPFLLAAGLSLTDFRLGSPLPVEFVGLKNYGQILADATFLRAVANNLIFLAGIVPLQTGLALGLALLLNHRLPGMAIFRTLFFMPVVFPMSLIAVIWVLIYAPGPEGMMNGVLDFLTLGLWEPKDFLRDPRWALPAVMLLSIWQGAGFQMVVLLAGLQAIPAERYEAAEIDGAGPWQKFVHVTLPGLRNPLIFVIVVTSILAFRIFDQVRIMTRGGPENATTTVVYEAVRAGFDRAQVGRGAAMTVVFFLIVLGITLLQRRWFRQEGEGG